MENYISAVIVIFLLIAFTSCIYRKVQSKLTARRFERAVVDYQLRSARERQIRQRALNQATGAILVVAVLGLAFRALRDRTRGI